MESKKIYLDSDNGRYNHNYTWEEADADKTLGESGRISSLKTKDARLYTLSCVESFIDDLSGFIKPSVLFKFIRDLEDANAGEELYNHLQENVRYVHDLVDSVRKRGEFVMASELEDYVFDWRQHHDDYSSECHLAPFGNGDLLMKWLLPHDEFLTFFKKELAKRNNEMFAIAYNTQEMRDVVKKGIEARIRFLEDKRKGIDREIENEKAKMKKWSD